MTREEAQQAWKKMRSEIDNTNWLFVGTINPQIVDIAIEALQADRPRGEWTLKMNERFYWKECSMCGHKPPRSDEYGTYIESNYCPNCGAKMDGERSEE